MRHRTPQFGHVFAGDSYSAGYYSYLWSDTLTADAFEAFTEAKALCLRSITNMTALRTMLPWMTADVEEMLELMGDDPWPYGIEPNRATIQTLLDDLVAQGLLDRPLEVDELFAPGTLSAYRL